MSKRVVRFDKKERKTYHSYRDKSVVYFRKIDLKNLQINNCAICRIKPKIIKEENHFFLECQECKSRSPVPAKSIQQAILNWNKSKYSEIPSYKRIKEFELEKFDTPQEAMKYLKVVRPILERRIKEAKEKRKTSARKPSINYVRTLKIYLQLCIYAQSVCKYWIKIEKEQTKNKSLRNKKRNSFTG